MKVQKRNYDRIVKLWEAGVRLKDLSYEYSCSKHYIRKILKSCGVVVVSRDHCKCGIGDVDKIISLYKSGYTLRMISVLFNIGHRNVLALIERHSRGCKRGKLENCINCGKKIEFYHHAGGGALHTGFCCKKCYREWIQKNYRGSVNNFIRLFWDGMRDRFIVKYIDGNENNCSLENLLVYEFEGSNIILFDGRRV